MESSRSFWLDRYVGAAEKLLYLELRSRTLLYLVVSGENCLRQQGADDAIPSMHWEIGT